ncbi:hypothetical protein RFI_08728 [Reticulomyxa filosa]|uniref:Uncharacterized protein n=1 Tax=Reticulomyxa filosa TaxID=46433 RepID=X6NR85_RETFI|nr:hypothetical protein RFI_08728 [Reticulomyxa filosa]|eukprot:ETO28408.1 hypothetical protein RFI_08728 [Reticulomyxa filosa]
MINGPSGTPNNTTPISLPSNPSMMSMDRGTIEESDSSSNSNSNNNETMNKNDDNRSDSESSKSKPKTNLSFKKLPKPETPSFKSDTSNKFRRDSLLSFRTSISRRSSGILDGDVKSFNILPEMVKNGGSSFVWSDIPAEKARKWICDGDTLKRMKATIKIHHPPFKVGQHYVLFHLKDLSPKNKAKSFVCRVIRYADDEMGLDDGNYKKKNK